ncbi:trypsin-like serine protease [Synechococcus sp. CCAP 1479/9]|uniref:trypsin-like serine protease n=1 Tax=Synechococcus sp. CCAP 1479/9 TaxID=1221593 RepID=UPI001C2472EC|nr:trypsin-like serine protease [Synechococcus sp. CCAP 1479/9]
MQTDSSERRKNGAQEHGIGLWPLKISIGEARAIGYISPGTGSRWGYHLSLFSILIIGAVMPASAGYIRNGTDDALYRSLANNYPSVGRLALKYANGAQGLCSGTMVSASWVITAAHCIDGLSSVSPIDDSFQVAANLPSKLSRSVFTIAGQNYGIRAGIKKSQWSLGTPGRPAWNFDIALLALEKPVQNVAPAILNRRINELSEIGVYVGYGQTGQGQFPQVGSEGTKRAGPNKVGPTYFSSPSPAGSLPLQLGTDWDQPFNFNTGVGRIDTFDGITFPLPYEYQFAPGDSGGGFFIGGPSSSPVGPLTIRAGSDEILAGVISHLLPIDRNSLARYGTEAYSVRIAPYADWVDAVLAYYISQPVPRPLASHAKDLIPLTIYTSRQLANEEVAGIFDNAQDFVLIPDTFRSSFDNLLPLELQTPDGNSPDPDPILNSVPIPLPILGVPVAYGYTRRLRKRVTRNK